MIWAVGKDGKRTALEDVARIEVDMSNEQKLWVNEVGPIWFLNDEPGVQVAIMGGPGAIAMMHPDAGNAWTAVALKEQRPPSS